MTIPAIIIRHARLEDAGEVAAMLAGLCEYEGVRKSEFKPEDFIRDGFGENRAFSALVAEINNQVIGFLTYYPGYDMPSAKRGYHLGDFYVKKEFRRRGVGKKLFAALAQIVLDNGSCWISWTAMANNRPALEMYAKFGAVTPKNVQFMAIGKNNLSILLAFHECGICS